jgi:multicomponent Na+:H+ antiporter subunit D
VVDMAAFAELWELRQSHAEIFASPAPWLVLAVLTALGGAFLMLGQRDLKRFLAFSSIEDMGYLVAGVVLAGPWGLAGALFGGLTHVLAKVLLFVSLCLPENKGPLTLARRGQALVFPLSGVGFLIGSLAMLGVPPLPGFSGRWRLYLTAYQVHPALMAVFVLASGLALLAYIRVLTAFWWYGEEDNPKPERQPLVLNLILAVLVLTLLAAGIYPALLPATLVGGVL